MKEQFLRCSFGIKADLSPYAVRDLNKTKQKRCATSKFSLQALTALHITRNGSFIELAPENVPVSTGAMSLLNRMELSFTKG